MKEAVFIDRPNRFTAQVLLNGSPVVCHVKNTGRCRELLVPSANVYIQEAANPARKTAYDLISVYKGGMLVNMDSNAPNTVFGEWLRGGGLGFTPEIVKPECTYGDSRFDFYFEHGGIKSFAEVKGVTLEDNGIARFPDAPTERGIKHLRGLIRAVQNGYEAYAVFILQMCGMKRFEPAWDKHRPFGETLVEAAAAGVKVMALECDVTRDSLCIAGSVPVFLD